MIPCVIVLLPLTWGYLPPLPPFSESNHRRDNECMKKGREGWMMMVMVVTMTMKIKGVIMLTLLEMINEIMTMTNEITY